MVLSMLNAYAQQPALLDRIAEGDEESMRQLIDRYTGLVWSLVRRKIGNASDAEDLVQDIFAEIWKSAHRYNSDMGSEDTFVAVITRRRVIDAIRKATRRTPQVPFDGVIEFSAAAESSQTIEENPDVAKAMQLITTLSPERRNVVELSVIHGLSHSQIVEATHLPLGTVKAHIRRGLEMIRSEVRSISSSTSAERRAK